MIAIVDYGLGNLGSVANMLTKAGGKCEITSQVESVQKARGLILPGVGSFDAGVTSLHQLGLVEVLGRRVLQEQVPILGICLGFQLMAESSEEGSLPGLNWIPATVKRLNPAENLPLPHMGWNDLVIRRADPLLTDLEHSRFYFVHSFHVVTREPSLEIAYASYGQEVCAAIHHQNIFATQFHPEKSHRFGLTLMKNFVNLVYAS